MFYANEDVDQLEKRLEVPAGESYVRRTALAVGKMLEKKPELYKTFGVYWWAIKSALRKYYNDPKAWFMGPFFDRLMYERAWHGSLFRTVLAGAFYQEQHPIITSGHEWTDSAGQDRQYTLIDENAGF